jgi:hypothetical protein
MQMDSTIHPGTLVSCAQLAIFLYQVLASDRRSHDQECTTYFCACVSASDTLTHRASTQVSRGKRGACGVVFVEVNGVVHCNVPSVKGLSPGSAPVFDNDHVFPLAAGVSPGDVATVVL